MAAIGTVAGVVFREFGSDEHVLQKCEQPIGDVLVERHTTFPSTVAQNTRPENYRVDPRCDNACHRSDEFRRVLIVRMEHDDDVSAKLERTRVARLLVTAVPTIALVYNDVANAELPRKLDCPIAAGIINQDDFVHDVVRNFCICSLERTLGIECRENDDDFFVLDHVEQTITVCTSCKYPVRSTIPDTFAFLRRTFFT